MGQIVDGDYIVASGDTLATVSARTNTPIRALIDNNALQPPYILKPGQRLQIAQRQAYVVRAGDTLSGIAHRYNVSQSALVDLNDLVPPYVIRIGQTLVLPSSIEAPQQTMVAQPIESAPAGEIASAPLAGTSAPLPAPAPTAAAASGGAGAQPGAKPFQPAPGVNPLPTSSATASATGQVAAAPIEPDLTAAEEAAERAYEESRQQAAATAPPAPAPAAQPAPSAVQPAPSATPTETLAATVGPPSKAGFSWPVQGKVIARFGTTADGLRNDGINIAAPAGAPVMAAADGTVAYAGNQLRGFGNLILLRHDNGLITAYAHNQSMLVEKGAKVKRGDVIARVGSTGSVDSPQLHFEIRKGEQAVDPLKYLDGGA